MHALAPAETVIAIRIAVALVFLLAAIGKLRHIAVFHGVVSNYRVLPGVLVRPAAYGLPAAEAIIGAVLLAGLYTPWAELAAAALLAVFAAAMAVNLLRGRRHIDCGCFQGTLQQRLRWRLVARNCGLAMLIAASPAPGAADRWTQFNGLMGGIALFLVMQALNALWAIGPGRPAAGLRPAQTEGM
jgi:hypothetical protein